MSEVARTDVCAIDEVPVGSFRLVQVNGREIGVVRLPDGECRAVLNRCPHRAAPICRGAIGGTWPPCQPGELAFARDGEVVVCPWHGWEFDLRTGNELFQAAPTRLRMYDVAVERGRVLIVTPRRHGETGGEVAAK
jgi:nitrite reductase/ring-hydroxylating ferredoxin subunit